MTYLALSAVFLAIALAVGTVAVLVRGPARVRALLPAAGLGAVALIVLTAVFDNVMIAVGLVRYADGAIWGIRIGLAPVEDFAYPLAAVILLPSLWVLLDRDADERD